MKGRISIRLEQALQNPCSRQELRDALDRGDGWVWIAGRRYRVRSTLTLRNSLSPNDAGEDQK